MLLSVEMHKGETKLENPDKTVTHRNFLRWTDLVNWNTKHFFTQFQLVERYNLRFDLYIDN